MKAMMKQAVAASRVGIISTPNQPMYRRLLVLVIHSQNRIPYVGAFALLYGCCHGFISAVIIWNESGFVFACECNLHYFT